MWDAILVGYTAFLFLLAPADVFLAVCRNGPATRRCLPGGLVGLDEKNFAAGVISQAYKRVKWQASPSFTVVKGNVHHGRNWIQAARRHLHMPPARRWMDARRRVTEEKAANRTDMK